MYTTFLSYPHLKEYLSVLLEKGLDRTVSKRTGRKQEKQLLEIIQVSVAVVRGAMSPAVDLMLFEN